MTKFICDFYIILTVFVKIYIILFFLFNIQQHHCHYNRTC